MIAMVIAGLGALLEASEVAFQIIKWVGVLYLGYLGLKMMVGREPRSPKESDLRDHTMSFARPIR